MALGYPIVVTALLATFSFSGCFLDCFTPSPGRGIAGAAILVVVAAWAVLSLLE